MKVLSLHAPHGSLFAAEIRTIETRSWAPPKDLIGKRIALQQAKKPPKEGAVYGDWTCHEMYDGRWAIVKNGPANRYLYLPLGAIVASGRLADCVPITDQAHQNHEWTWTTPHIYDYDGQYLYTAGMSPTPRCLQYHWVEPSTMSPPPALTSVSRAVEDQRPYGDFTPGRFAWIFDEVEALDPIPFVGGQCLSRSWVPA